MRQKRAGSVEIKIQLPCQTHNMRRFEGVVSLQHTQIWSRAPKTIRATTLRNQHTIARIVLGISITRESLATSELQAHCVCVRTVAGQYVKHGAAVKKSMPYNWKKNWLTHKHRRKLQWASTYRSGTAHKRNCDCAAATKAAMRRLWADNSCAYSLAAKKWIKKEMI